MVAFDKDGYVVGAPLKANRWPEVRGPLPEGVIISRGTVPPGFFMVQNFLDAATCDALVRECDALAGERHTVAGDGFEQNRQDVTQATARSSEFIDTRTLNADINKLMRNAFLNVAAPNFRVEIDWFELPEILRYRPGGEYKSHADADNWDPVAQEWRRVVDRDLSLLLYLNEGFEGGEIVFPNFGLSLPPKRGLLIIFPSNRLYLHAARPVKSGVRYAVVSWAAVKGSVRVGDGPRPHATKV